MSSDFLKRSQGVALGALLLSLLISSPLSADEHRPFTDVRGSLSGSWFDPTRNGEGFIFEFGLNPNSPAVTVYWFTHLDDEPYWLFSSVEYEGELFDQTGLIEFDLLEASGTGFGEEFDQEAIELFDRGTLSFVFDGCNKASASWTPPKDFDLLGSETLVYDLRRITLGLDGASCESPDEQSTKNVNNAPPLLQGALSGSWFDPSRNGEGFVFEFGRNPDTSVATVYWFTHRNGAPYWLMGTASYLGDEQLLDFELLEISGTGFGADFDPEGYTIEPWGEISFGFTTCKEGLAVWGNEEGTTGVYGLKRITLGLDGITCGITQNESVRILAGITTETKSLSGELVVLDTWSIAEGATVTLLPGTIIRLAHAATLTVAGNLIAVGTSDNPIFFTCIQTCVNDLAEALPWEGIDLFNSQQSRFKSVVIEGARNAFTLSGRSKLILEDSLIRNNLTAVTDPFGYEEVFIKNNTFHNNFHTFELRLNGNSEISNNEFLEVNRTIFSRNGFYFGATSVHGNNFLVDIDEQSNLPIVLYGPKSGFGYGVVDAAHNWWGTADELLISEMIYDSSQDVRYQAVNFMPFLNSPSVSAGSTISSQLETPD